MAAGKLRPLRVFGGELVSDAVEQLDVALLWVLLHCVDECPGHSACGFGGDSGISPMMYVSMCMPRQSECWMRGG
jgi:hypothetical protein